MINFLSTSPIPLKIWVPSWITARQTSVQLASPQLQKTVLNMARFATHVKH